METTQLLSKDLFLRRLAAELDLDAAMVTPELVLVDDLEFDSLHFVRTAVFIDSLVPFEFPDVDLETLTVDALYQLYCREFGVQFASAR